MTVKIIDDEQTVMFTRKLLEDVEKQLQPGMNRKIERIADQVLKASYKAIKNQEDTEISANVLLDALSNLALNLSVRIDIQTLYVFFGGLATSMTCKPQYEKFEQLVRSFNDEDAISKRDLTFRFARLLNKILTEDLKKPENQVTEH